MKKFFILYFLCLFSFHLCATTLEQWKKATVKINSFPCLTERPRFNGSGILLSYNKELWIITSEHIVIHDQNSKTCHQAHTSTIPSFTNSQRTESSAALELVSVDYKMGLALLRIPSPNTLWKDGALEIENLENNPKKTEVSDASKLVSLGFPSQSSQLQTLQEGKILNQKSQRALIAGVNSFIEASHLPIEYGMSGGLLLALDLTNPNKKSQKMRNEQKKSYSFLGLLSHQVLRRKPGHPTNAEEIKPSFPSDQNDLAIAIPATHILTWFKDQFQKNEELTWQRNPEDQIKGRTVIQYGPLQFSLKTAQGKDIWDVGGADGSGVGGEAFGRNDFELSSSE